MLQLSQIVGAFLVLAGFALVHTGRLPAAGVVYFILNLAGALLLLISAVADTQWGFIILEVAWAAISTRGLIQAIREA